MANNQDLYAAVARVDEARAIARISRSQFFPELSLDPSFRRERTSANQPIPIPFQLPSMHLNTYSLPLDLSYEVDLWGRIRRANEAARAVAGVGPDVSLRFGQHRHIAGGRQRPRRYVGSDRKIGV